MPDSSVIERCRRVIEVAKATAPQHLQSVASGQFEGLGKLCTSLRRHGTCDARPQCHLLPEKGFCQVFGVTVRNTVVLTARMAFGANQPVLGFAPGMCEVVESENLQRTDRSWHGIVLEGFMKKIQSQYQLQTGYGGGGWSLENTVLYREPDLFRGHAPMDRGALCQLVIAIGIDKVNDNGTTSVELTFKELADLLEAGDIMDAYAYVCASLGLQHLRRKAIWSPEIERFRGMLKDVFRHGVMTTGEAAYESKEIQYSAKAIGLTKEQSDRIIKEVATTERNRLIVETYS